MKNEPINRKLYILVLTHSIGKIRKKDNERRMKT